MTVSFHVIRWAGEQEPKAGDEIGPTVAKFVLMALANYARDDGQAWPTVERIALYTCAGERTVRRALQVLADQGLISDTGIRKGATGQTKVWQLASPARESKVADMAGYKVATSSAKVATSSAEGGQDGRPLYKDDPVIEPIRNQGVAPHLRTQTPKGMRLPGADRQRVIAQLVSEGTSENRAARAWDRVLRRGGSGPSDFAELLAWVREEAGVR